MNPFQKFLLALKGIFVKEVHAVDNILADFQKTVNRLEAAAEHHVAQAAEHAAAALEAEAKKLEAQAEANRAQAASEKIKNLLA